jgi:hypothetical protein
MRRHSDFLQFSVHALHLISTTQDQHFADLHYCSVQSDDQLEQG